MNKVNHILKITLATLVAIAPSLNYAAIMPYSTFNEYETINNQTKELNLSVLEKAYLISVQYQFRMEDYVPYTSMPDWDNGKKISGKILKHTLQTMFDEGSFGNSDAAVGLTEMNNSLSTQISNSKHNLQLKLRAIEAKAVISYKGFLKAQFTYDVAQNDMEMEIYEQYGNKTIALTHTDDGSERKEILGIRWNF